MNLRFTCPVCQRPGRITLSGPGSWQCPACDHLLPLAAPQVVGTAEGDALSTCVICGNGELYKKKGFPHWLGLSILTAACAAFLVLHLYRLQWWAWVVLIGSAVFDGVLYLLVGDVVVCYRCGAHHAWTGRCGNKPFELTIAERYRQERLRREQLKQKSM